MNLRLIGLWLCLVFSSAPWAEPARLAIIIDDLGNDYAAAQRVLQLPPQITLAILPRLHYSRRIAEQAHRNGHEIMLHQPMSSLSYKAMGPGGLTLLHTLADIDAVLQANLASVPHVSGVNNHMGSLMTRDPDSMRWLMSALRRQGDLFFVDSRTDPGTQAERVARENGVKSARRDVFLDNDSDKQAIRAQFEQAYRLARERGSAIVIGHPYPQTLAVTREQMARWPELGIVLTPVSQVIAHQRSPDSWHASSSPLPRVAKNSKR